MTTMMKRIQAVLCSLVMLFSDLPFAAAAEKIAAKACHTDRSDYFTEKGRLSSKEN